MSITTAEILDEVRAIDWENYRFPEMPNWIEGLTSQDASIRKNSVQAIDDLFLEMPLYAWEHLVVRYLTRLLEIDDIRGKNDLIFLISLMAMTAEGYTKSTYPETLYIANRLFNELSYNLPTYLRFLDDEKTKADVISILSTLRHDGVFFVPKMIAVIDEETHLNSKSEYIRELTRLVVDNEHLLGDVYDKTIHYFEHLAKVDDPEIQLTAALALARLMKHETPEYVEQILERTNSAGHFILEAILYTGTKRALQFYIRVCQFARERTDVIGYLKFALGLAFGNNTIINNSGSFDKRTQFTSFITPRVKNDLLLRPARLTTLQKRLLDAILANPRLWEHKTDLFEIYGLPSTRDELRTFVDRCEIIDTESSTG